MNSLKKTYNFYFIIIPLFIFLILVVSQVVFEVHQGKEVIAFEIKNYRKHIENRMQTEVANALVLIDIFLQDNSKQNMNAEIQGQIIRILESHSSPDVGYYFAADYQGNTMIGPAKGTNVYEITDSTGRKIVQELIQVAQKGGGFIEYIMPPLEGHQQIPKLSYVLPVPQLSWYLGAGVFLSEIKVITDRIEKQTRDRVFATIIIFGIVSAVIILILTTISLLVYRRLDSEILCIKAYLQDSKNTNVPIHISSFSFIELLQIATLSSENVQKNYAAQEILEEQNQALRHMSAELSAINRSLEEEIVEHNKALELLQKSNIKNEFLSYHDQLTGLYNRMFFETELERLNTQRNLPLTIIMIDINGLKLLNDAFGHKKGDEVLLAIASNLTAICRSDEIIARIGGDEFVLLLPQTNETHAEQLTDRIYTSIQSISLDNIIISVSVGSATKTDEEVLIEDVVSEAEENMFRRKLTEGKSMRNQTIQMIMKTLNEKNQREKIHSERVSEICKKIAEAMNLEYSRIKEIETAGLLHDIGKIVIDEKLLNKQGRLTEEEYLEVKKHPEISYQILRTVDIYAALAEDVMSHHERWDGNGYPRGLSGENISLTARIISVADSFEAMTADRSYRKSMGKEEAMQEIIRNSGTQFDPQIVAIFTTLYTSVS